MPYDRDFAAYCRKLTDTQLANVILQEHCRRNRGGDCDTAEGVARERGWDQSRITEARNRGA